jgi:hypothetical protein
MISFMTSFIYLPLMAALQSFFMTSTDVDLSSKKLAMFKVVCVGQQRKLDLSTSMRWTAMMIRLL